jgi:hypothetical protein
VLLFERRNLTVEPFNETVQQVFARVSALRDRLDYGAVCDRQTVGLVYSALCTVRTDPLVRWQNGISATIDSRGSWRAVLP